MSDRLFAVLDENAEAPACGGASRWEGDFLQTCSRAFRAGGVLLTRRSRVEPKGSQGPLGPVGSGEVATVKDVDEPGALGGASCRRDEGRAEGRKLCLFLLPTP